MPLPLIPIAIALFLAGAGGVGAGAKGVYDMNQAQDIVKKSKRRYGDNLKTYQAQEAQTRVAIEKHGRRQLRAQSTTLSDWADWLEVNEHQVRRLEHSVVDGVEVSIPDLPALKVVVVEAKGLLAGATSAAVSAVAAQQAALAGVRALAVAGTGAAISTLSGAAAESATLAWLGGGAVAAGGGGVAAGTVVLSGVAIAPALLVGGITLAIQGEKAVTQAEAYRAKVQIAIEEMKTNTKLLKRLERRTAELETVLARLNRQAGRSLMALSEIAFDPSQHASQFLQTALLMRSLAEVIDTPLLDSNGHISEATTTITERHAA